MKHLKISDSTLENFSTIPARSERGWDLGPFAAMLVPGQKSPSSKM